jgi:hypothetical protein
MKVSKVIVLAPTRSRIDPNFGIDSATKSRITIVPVLNAHRFQLKSVH